MNPAVNANFPRIISLLRKEAHISQKQAAAELGISQALLSHYEKGIRECGLDFVVRVADYYSVSCDYLLGRSPDRNGSTLSVETIPEPDSAGKENIYSGAGILPTLNKKLIANSLNVLFDLVSKTKNRLLIEEVSGFLMLSVYRMFRVVYRSNPKNQDGLFSVPQTLSSGYADAAMRLCEANAEAIVSGQLSRLPVLGEVGEVEPVTITSQALSSGYPLFATSLMNLVKNAEDRMKSDSGNGKGK